MNTPAVNPAQPASPWPRVAAILLGLAVLALLYYYFDPAQRSFFPPCLFKRWTGWSCLGCGCQRALHELLHGHWAAAYHLNPLIYILVPAGAAWLLQQASLRWRGRPIFPRPRTAQWVWWLVGASVAFTIVRNLPSSPWRG